MPTVPVDQSESEKCVRNGVTKVFTVIKYGPTIKHLFLEGNLVQQYQNCKRKAVPQAGCGTFISVLLKGKRFHGKCLHGTDKCD